MANSRCDPNGYLLFDYNLEDTNPSTEPIRHPESHFRDIKDVENALAECCCDDHILVERLMHQGQDYQVHFRKGYRGVPWKEGWLNGDRLRIRYLGTGHGAINVIDTLTLEKFTLNPDDDDEAWKDAADWTNNTWYPKWVEFKTKCDK